MKITYIHHSAFFVETKSACLLFDWFAGDIPPIPKEKSLYVLASHIHEDHFSETIFSLSHPRITFLLSYDIPDSLVPEKVKEKTYFLNPHEKWQDPVLSLETFRSTDEGIAFWCHVDGKQIYHAGDLNHWYWEGEDDQWNWDMTDSYRTEMEMLAGRTADIAFLPVDPRLEQWFYLGTDDYMDQADALHIFPMHFWEDFSVCKKLMDHPCAESYRDRIISITEKGQIFSL